MAAQQLERIRAEHFMADVANPRVQQIIRAKMKGIVYSDKYNDDTHEYRHVSLPTELSKLLPKNHLMSDREWRSFGVQQSLGWEHYMIHRPEPHILLFKRPLDYQPPAQQQA